MTERTQCLWKQDRDGEWETACNNDFVLNSGTPADNGMNFCCHCSNPLVQQLYKDGDD